MPSCRTLSSYSCGEWYEGKGEGQLAVDASSSVPVARVDSTGLDVEGMLEFGRERGGQALRQMTFHQRALMLKALGQYLLQHKETFYQLSYATGATRTDSWIDIDGGISTLLSYGSKGRRELPNSKILVEGQVEALSKDQSFSGVHILSALQGVAIHINAYNFPVWGMLEKIAPTLLAGVPTIVKPASQTAYLTELVFRYIIQSNLLPAGSIQLICGSVGTLLDSVTPQDVVSFTGSASVGRQLKTHPTIVAQSTRFTMEADSLNASILGVDAAPGTPEFEQFISEVYREMTVKTGQKCTAIRRILVPRRHEQAVGEALRDRIKTTVQGDPRLKNVTMGPLASREQWHEVQAQLQQLRKETELLWQDPADNGKKQGNCSSGGFMDPVLLYCKTPLQATKVHQVEAFGPVATLMPYDQTEDAIELTKRGQGSLVVSIFSQDKHFAAEVVKELAPWHGRVLLGSRQCEQSSTGHGSPLPMLVHGGPGRAGGGEELGGVRAVKHYMQRSALQGTPEYLSTVIDQWVAGAPKASSDVHPFRKTLDELMIGDYVQTGTRQITLSDIEHFAHFTGDTFYAHMDDTSAKANPFFEGRVAHGYLIVSLAAGLFVEPAPGPVLANYGVDNLRFLTPMYPGDTISVTLVCKQINSREAEDYGEVRWDCTVNNQEAAVVAQYDVLTLVSKQ